MPTQDAVLTDTTQTEQNLMTTAFGPSGGYGGAAFNAPAPGQNGSWRISGVEVRSGSSIDQIELTWTSQSGATQSSDEFGGEGGAPSSFGIAAGDYLTAIVGSVCTYNNLVLISSLQCFTKNGYASSVFGIPTNRNFYFECPAGYQIIGIFGRSGSELDALGVYIDEING